MRHVLALAAMLTVCLGGLSGCRESGDAAPDPVGNDGAAGTSVGKAEEPVTIADVKLFPFRAGGVSGSWGYIDRTGKMVIEPRFDYAHPFHEGRALINEREDEDDKYRIGKYGIIDESGRMILEPKYAFAYDFAEGFAAVIVSGQPNDKTARWGYVDASGRLAIPGPFLEAASFSEGLACVRVAEGPDAAKAKWGFVDKSGKMVIAPQYSRAMPFSEGLAAVAMNDRWGFIDTAGRTVIEPKFAYAWPFSEGLAVAHPLDTYLLSGYIDRKGEFVIPAKYPHMGAGPFRNGRARVKLTSFTSFIKDYGYIDRTGAMVIPTQYGVADDFSEGVAMVWAGRLPSRGSKCSYIDRRGRPITPDAFDAAKPFRGGLAQVEIEIDNTWYMGYLDRQGRYVVDPWKAAGVPEGDPRRVAPPPSQDDSVPPKKGASTQAELSAKAEGLKTRMCKTYLRSLSARISSYSTDRKPVPSLEWLVEQKHAEAAWLRCPHSDGRRTCDYFYYYGDPEPPKEMAADRERQREWRAEWETQRIIACDFDPHATDANTRGVMYVQGKAYTLTPDEFAKELAKPVNKAFADAFRKAGGK